MSGYNCPMCNNSTVCVIKDPAPEQCAKCKVPNIYKGKRPNEIKPIPRKLIGADIRFYFEDNSPGFKHMPKEQQEEVIQQILLLQERTWNYGKK